MIILLQSLGRVRLRAVVSIARQGYFSSVLLFPVFWVFKGLSASRGLLLRYVAGLVALSVMSLGQRRMLPQRGVHEPPGSTLWPRERGNLNTLLPPNVAVQTCRASDLSRVLVMAEEESAIATAVDSRRREFSIGRACARAALSKLGFPPCAIPVGPHREPVWPPGVVGSITHTAEFYAAAVAQHENYAALGIDAEADDELPSGVLELVSVDEERYWLANAPGNLNWDRLLFSAKESIFKAWFPLTREWLGFEDAVVTIMPHKGTFCARVLHTLVPVDHHARELRGRFVIANGLILTAVFVKMPQKGASSSAV